MVLVNFALETLGTEVSCDKVSTDGYEPRNLLGPQNGMAWRRYGFMAESFIKPPVTLTFKLPCPVHLKSIILDPREGSQRSSVIEIYSAADCRPKWSPPASVTQQAGHTSQKRNDGDPPQMKPEPVFKKIGNIRCLEPGHICFSNPRFRGDHSATACHSSESYPHHAELRHHQAAMLVAVDTLAIRIVGTANSTVPAIGKLEIWGVPARVCSTELRSSLIQKYISAVSPQPGCLGSSVNHQVARHLGENMKHSQCQKFHTVYKDQCRNTEHAWKTSHNAESLNSRNLPLASPNAVQANSAVEIPEQFLDAVTYEIMSSPMLLPSGQCVDMSTLDRFFGEEANYGRSPSDPFTGLSFTASRKPVSHASLKVHIDHFLIKHANEPSFHSLPRGLGHAQKPLDGCNDHSVAVENDQTCSGNSRPSFGSKVRNLKRVMQNPLQHRSPTVQQGDFTRNDFQSVSVVSPSAPKRMKTEMGGFVDQTKTITGISCNSMSDASDGSGAQTVRSPTAASMETHEERLRSSLLSSLASVLGKLPSFSSQHAPSSADSAEERCSNCQTKLKQTDSGNCVIRPTETVMVYRFPCQHLVCRACLMTNAADLSVFPEVTCSACCKSFARGDLVRAHI
ncbi:hypothetical protein ACOMHN_041911 [Nucella lapillus]